MTLSNVPTTKPIKEPNPATKASFQFLPEALSPKKAPKNGAIIKLNPILTDTKNNPTIVPINPPIEPHFPAPIYLLPIIGITKSNTVTIITNANKTNNRVVL